MGSRGVGYLKDNYCSRKREGKDDENLQVALDFQLGSLVEEVEKELSDGISNTRFWSLWRLLW